MRRLTESEATALRETAGRVRINPLHLAAEIEFESRWDPQIKNPSSSARGLLQFMDSTAYGMGYELSEDRRVELFGDRNRHNPKKGASLALIEACPTCEEQLRGPVIKYLEPYSPFPTLQTIAMAVFYPAARHWSEDDEFPENVQAANRGIATVGDYMDRVKAELPGVEEALSWPETPA